MDYKEEPLRVVQISMWDLTGHIFNGYDLSESLNTDSRYRASMLVLFKQSVSDLVRPICGPIGFVFLKITKYIERLLSIQNILSPIYQYIRRNDVVRRADVIHLQLVHFNYFSLRMIQRLSKKKRVVWTLHDLWAVTGHCIHPLYAHCERWREGCGHCPDLSVPFPLFIDTTRFLRRHKAKIFRNLDIDIVVSSEFMLSVVRESGIFPEARFFKIPFGANTKVLFPREKGRVRKDYGVPLGDFVVMFRVDQGKFKGTPYIKEMLEILDPDGVTLISVGQKGILSDFQSKFNIVEHEWIHSDELLADLYNMADMFLMPSRAESFGLMAIEAMACKTPVIAFRNSAIEEILSGGCGVLVDDESSAGLAAAVTGLREDVDMRSEMAERGYNKVSEHYSYDAWVGQIKELYEDKLKPVGNGG